jgi:hypothetical protein
LSLIGGTTTTITSANNLNILSYEENINLTATNDGTNYFGEVFINKQLADTGDGILNVGTITLTNASNTLTIDETSITHSSPFAVSPLDISSNSSINMTADEIINLTSNNNEINLNSSALMTLYGSTLDITSTGNYIGLTSADYISLGAVSDINLTSPTFIGVDSQGGSTKLGDVNGFVNQTKIELDDSVGSIHLTTTIGNIEIDSKNGSTKLGDVNGYGNATTIEVNDGTGEVLLTAPIGDINLTSPTFIRLDSGAGSCIIGDINTAGNSTYISIDDGGQAILLYAIGGSVSLETSSGGSVFIGDISGGNAVTITDASIFTQTTLGVILTKSTIKLPRDVRSANYNFTDYTNAIQTFTTASTLTLFTIDDERCGRQFTITNTSAGNLTINTSGGQLIYSATGTTAVTTKSLATNRTHIITAIQTSVSPEVYGWSLL